MDAIRFAVAVHDIEHRQRQTLHKQIEAVAGPAKDNEELNARILYAVQILAATTWLNALDPEARAQYLDELREICFAISQDEAAASAPVR